MSDDPSNPEAAGYLITLVPPAEPGSAADRAVYDYIRKLGASVDTFREPETAQASERLDAPFSSLAISSATTLRPHPDSLHIPALRTDDSELGSSSGSSDSTSDAASPTNAQGDSVDSVSEPSDAEHSPIHTQASHRIFNMPSYMPLTNTGRSTASHMPGYKFSRLINPAKTFKHQIFVMLVKIHQDVPPRMALRYTSDTLPTFRLLFDPAYSTILTIGTNCQKMDIPDSDMLTLPLNPQYYRGFYGETDSTAHAQILVHPHCPWDGQPIAATEQLSDVHYGCTKFFGGCSAVAALTEDEQQLRFVNCFQWGRTSWDSQLTISCRIGVAHCISGDLAVGGMMDGIIGFAPTDRQTVFDVRDPFHAPSVLASLETASELASVDSNDGGVVVYCAMRPFALWIVDQTTGMKRLEKNPHNSWIALNKWPVRNPESPAESTPVWSGRIKISEIDAKTPTWNVLLLSMKFGRFDHDSKKWFDIPNGEIVFNGGLVTVLDPGCSASWVPPEVVRRIRTTLFPCPHNEELDRRRGDRPHLPSDFLPSASKQLSDLNYAVEPSKVAPQLCKVQYTFSNGPDKPPIVVDGPAEQFICALNPHARQDHPEYEGLLFVPQPGRIPTKHRGAIFGINFFQSMFVAFCKPSNKNRRPYVLLAPQWRQEITKYGPPPHDDDD